MSSQQPFSKNSKLKLSEKKLKIDLAEMFSGVLKNDMKTTSFNRVKHNFNKVLEFNIIHPRAKIKTQRIVTKFEEFLKVFEK